MKIVFLDFDGPIIPTRVFAMNPGLLLEEPCRTSGALINEVLRRADAKLVVSSTWRKQGLEDCKVVLRKANIDLSRLHFWWRTEDLYPLSREDEIERWVKERGGGDRGNEFIAIDDMPLYKLESKHRVQCSSDNGFLFEHYLEACEKLHVSPFNKPNPI